VPTVEELLAIFARLAFVIPAEPLRLLFVIEPQLGFAEVPPEINTCEVLETGANTVAVAPKPLKRTPY
jgi:hypothetical protein